MAQRGTVDLRPRLDDLPIDGDWSASPLFHFCGLPLDKLPRNCSLLFLFPNSVRKLGFELSQSFGSSRKAGVYLTHGLASIVCIGDGRLIDRIRSAALPSLLASECWRIQRGGVADVERWQTDCQPFDAPVPIADTGLPEIAATQVRQFNANLAALIGNALHYAPDLLPLLVSTHASMANAVTTIRRIAARNDFDAHKEVHSRTSELIEVNAAITMLFSQAFSAVPDLLNSRYCVAEYSLLGIGGAIRGIWRLYRHLEDAFFTGGIVQRVRGKFPADPPFPVFKERALFRPEEWAVASPLASGGNDDPDDSAEYQIPYFSSRWGFHETLHTLSVSWQCIHSGARPQWNLLTVSHEFLHTHVHELLDTLFPATLAERRKLVDLYNTGPQQTADYANGFDSSRVALVVAMVHLNHIAAVSPDLTGTWQLETSISEDSLEVLRQNHWWYINEIIVHVLDFLYIYKGHDAAYVESLWQSWSLVPKVAKSISHYLERTICALAATSPSHADSSAAFRDAFGRLMDILRSLVSRRGHHRATPVIREALRACENKATKDALRIEFEASYYIVCLARDKFHDNRLHSTLLSDDLAEPRRLGKRYSIPPGTFPERPIESPVGFLLDRFASGTPETQIALASVWQLLALVEGTDG